MLQRDIHAFWKKYIVGYVFCSLLAMHYCMLVHIPIEIVREDHKASELFIIWTNICLNWVMSDINYDTNAIRSSFQDTNYLIRFCKALMDFYSLTIFTYNRTRNKFDSKFIFMIVLTTLTAMATMTTKQFNLVPFCRSS